ncbi:MAG TPA: glycosyltransferase family 4 protein [Chthonomonadaceae bacterium]|nr:glycosyltransferase family 4 protein [Chthonomonadaceae bacterium]
MDKRLLIIGPLPPPYGGYAHQVASFLRHPFADAFTLLPYDTRLHDAVETRPLLPVLGRAARQVAVFRPFLAANRPDRVVLFTALTGCFWRDLLLLRRCYRAGLPTIIKLIGGDSTLRLEAQPAPLKRLALAHLARAAAILVETEEMVKHLSQLLPNTRAYRFPNFIHSEDVPARPKQTRPDGPLGVIYFGNMTPTKGVETILAGVDKVCDRQETTFHFVGGELEPGYLERFRARVCQLRHADCVQVHGRLPRERAHALAGACQIFAFPTQWPGEGQPAALVEAMSLGLVPVATRWRGVAEIVRHEHNGLALQSPDPELLARAILRLGQDCALRERLAQNAVGTIQNEYEAHAALQLFQQIMAQAIPV